MGKENEIEKDLIKQLIDIKYTHRPDIIDRKTGIATKNGTKKLSHILV